MNEIQKLSHTIVNYSLKLEKEERVLITSYEECLDLILALIEEINKVGAIPFVRIKNDILNAKLLEYTTKSRIKTLHILKEQEVENYDAFINIRYTANDYEELKVENKETTNKSAKIAYKIDEENTDKRLIQILNELTIKIVEEPKNSEENAKKETNKKEKDNIVYTNTLTGEEIEKLKLGETKEINYEPLKSNTTYKIEISGDVELGNTKEEIPVTYTYNKFTTLKIPAKVEIKNQFVTGNLIDLDVRIEDKDNSVLNNKVRMELRDEKSNLIDLAEIETNKDYVRKTYEKLTGNHRYKLSFYADQYNEGSTDETYKVNYLIKELEIVTEPGISGSIGLTELTRKETGKS